MNQRIDQFRETFRIKLMQADSDLSALKGKIDAKAETAERDARASLAAVTKRIEQTKPEAGRPSGSRKVDQAAEGDCAETPSPN